MNTLGLGRGVNTLGLGSIYGAAEKAYRDTKVFVLRVVRKLEIILEV